MSLQQTKAQREKVVDNACDALKPDNYLKAELEQIAKDVGLEVTGTKADLCTAIKKAIKEDQEVTPTTDKVLSSNKEYVIKKACGFLTPENYLKDELQVMADVLGVSSEGTKAQLCSRVKNELKMAGGGKRRVSQRGRGCVEDKVRQGAPLALAQGLCASYAPGTDGSTRLSQIPGTAVASSTGYWKSQQPRPYYGYGGRKTKSRGGSSCKKKKSSQKGGKRKSSQKGGACKKQTTKKYATRPSPPYPANECCNKRKRGNDGRMWVSKAASNGICRWVPYHKQKGGSKRKSPQKGGSKRSQRGGQYSSIEQCMQDKMSQGAPAPLAQNLCQQYVATGQTGLERTGATSVVGSTGYHRAAQPAMMMAPPSQMPQFRQGPGRLSAAQMQMWQGGAKKKRSYKKRSYKKKKRNSKNKKRSYKKKSNNKKGNKKGGRGAVRRNISHGMRRRRSFF